MYGNTDWHDTGGDKFSCTWYGSKASRCPKYGSKYENGGMVANDACCACGGGDFDDDATADVCADATSNDGSPWHDEGGTATNCEWYAAKSTRCKRYGHKYAFEGRVANDACCVCDGGFTQTKNVQYVYDPDAVVITAQLRLFNLTTDQMGSAVESQLITAFEATLNLPAGNLAITSYQDFELPKARAKPHNPFSTRPGRNLANGFNFKPMVPITNAVDLKIDVTTSDIASFRSDLKRAIMKGALKQSAKRVLSTVTRVSRSAPLKGPACLNLCNAGNPTSEGDMDVCYCSQECLRMGDCCPSFHSMPCLPEKVITWAPTPSGPGDHWLPENSKWNLFNHVNVKPIGQPLGGGGAPSYTTLLSGLSQSGRNSFSGFSGAGILGGGTSYSGLSLSGLAGNNAPTLLQTLQG